VRRAVQVRDLPHASLVYGHILPTRGASRSARWG
jgi:hypothetical protein